MDIPLLSGTLLVGAGGWLAYNAKDLGNRAFSFIRSRIGYTVEISSNEFTLFTAVRQWLGSVEEKARYLDGHIISKNTSDDKSMFNLSPRGAYILRYKGRRLLVWSTKEAIEMSDTYREKIIFQTLFGNRQVFLDIMEDAYEYANELHLGLVEILVPDSSYSAQWRTFEHKLPRKRETLCLAGEVTGIFDDAKRFLEERDWYNRMNIPYRRGYLLHGPPGNGKSSIAHALATELGVGINVANLSSFKSDQNFIDILSKVAPDNILLLEDIDSCGVERIETTKSAKSGVTFSGLINALDGITAREGRIMIMTTNHVDKLDPALIRPGRADKQIFMDNANYQQARLMHERFFPEASGESADMFATRFNGSSMAVIQEHLLQLKEKGLCGYLVSDCEPSGSKALVEKSHSQYGVVTNGKYHTVAATI